MGKYTTGEMIAGGAVVGVMGLFIVAAVLGLSFLFTSGLVWLVCWAFSLTFTWKVSFGVWVSIMIAKSIFKSKK